MVMVMAVLRVAVIIRKRYLFSCLVVLVVVVIVNVVAGVYIS